MSKNKSQKLARVFHFDLYGKRKEKYDFLLENSLESVQWKELDFNDENYFFVPKDFSLKDEYEKGFKIDELFIINTSGVKTHNDDDLVSFIPFDEHNQKYDYRPFDTRFICYDLKKVVRPRISVMKHFIDRENIGLVTCRQQSTFDFQHVFVTKLISDMCNVSSQTKETGYIFPLYLYIDTYGQQSINKEAERKANLNASIINELSQRLGLPFTEEKFPSSGGDSPPLEGCPKGGVVKRYFKGNQPPPTPSRGEESTTPYPLQRRRICHPLPLPKEGKRNTQNYMALPYNPKLKERAQELKKAGNLSEVLFWNQVKNNQFKNLDFDRQKIIGNYIVDFYCANCNVVIEIDGCSHDDKQEYDAARDEYLKGLGLEIIHIADIDIKKNLNTVMAMLFDHPVFQTTPALPEEGKGEEYSPPLEGVGGGFAPIDILDYIYAVLHSPGYREKYKEFLKIDFPRVPYPENAKQFWKLVELGERLRRLHLLENVEPQNGMADYPIAGSNEVEKPYLTTGGDSPPLEGCPKDGVVQQRNPKEKDQPPPTPSTGGEFTGRVYINNTQYFDNVPLVAWEFYIGGYQPAQKWLKDRKGRTLNFDDIRHYQRMIVALKETEEIMKEIKKTKIGG